MTEIRKEIYCKLIHKDKYILKIAQNGIYQFKESDTKAAKKLFDMKGKIHIKILKTEILNNNKYRFTVKIWQEVNVVEIYVEGKQDLERIFRLVGPYFIVVGLQQIVTSFKKVGEGSFAQVYEAITNYQTRFALKCFDKKGIQSDQKTKKSYLNQIDIMKHINSPYIVSFDYIFQTQKAFYLKMQYFEKSLKQKLSSRKLLIKQQKIIMKNLLKGLKELKIKNIIHRDLKPDNIMVRKTANNQQQYVIIDFGLATYSDANPYLYVRCGTPGFLSPQIANLSNKKEKQHCSSDMFSLACIFFKILTGKYLFGGKSVKQVLQNNRKCQYNNQLLQHLSINEKDLLLKMLQINPSKRITPEQALQHKYFIQDIDDADEIPDQECGMEKNIKKLCHPFLIKNMESVYSSSQLIQSSLRQNSTVKRQKISLKDSCATFQLPVLPTEEDTLNKSKTKTKNISKTPDKGRRQSRFSKIGHIVFQI